MGAWHDQNFYLGKGKRKNETDENFGSTGIEESTKQKFEILWKIKNFVKTIDLTKNAISEMGRDRVKICCYLWENYLPTQGYCIQNNKF